MPGRHVERADPRMKKTLWQCCRVKIQPGECPVCRYIKHPQPGNITAGRQQLYICQAAAAHLKPDHASHGCASRRRHCHRCRERHNIPVLMSLRPAIVVAILVPAMRGPGFDIYRRRCINARRIIARVIAPVRHGRSGNQCQHGACNQSCCNGKEFIHHLDSFRVRASLHTGKPFTANVKMVMSVTRCFKNVQMH